MIGCRRTRVGEQSLDEQSAAGPSRSAQVRRSGLYRNRRTARRRRPEGLANLWFNTGTLCNLTCHHCYIESSPKNDPLAYLTAAEAARYLDEIERDSLPTSLIGFTGGCDCGIAMANG
jgi:sulfatase maturation enzyme AslB (radical SAM superfamily)